MKSKEIDSKIKSILSEIDNFSESSKYLHQVGQKYIEVREIYFNEKGDKKNAKKMQWIIDVLNFRISNNKIEEMMKIVLKKNLMKNTSRYNNILLES